MCLACRRWSWSHLVMSHTWHIAPVDQHNLSNRKKHIKIGVFIFTTLGVLCYFFISSPSYNGYESLSWVGIKRLYGNYKTAVQGPIPNLFFQSRDLDFNFEVPTVLFNIIEIQTEIELSVRTFKNRTTMLLPVQTTNHIKRLDSWQSCLATSWIIQELLTISRLMGILNIKYSTVLLRTAND